MSRELISLQIKRVEKELPKLSAKVADATELLISVQLALEELYVSLGNAER